MADLRSHALEKDRLKALKKSALVSLGEVRITSDSGWQGRLPLAFGVNAIYGSNAAGKSSLLQGIVNAFSDNCGVVSPGALSKPAESQLIFSEYNSRIPQCEYIPSESFSNNLQADEVVYLDAMSRSERLLADFITDPNWEDLLDGVDPYEFSADELKIASFLLNGDYEAVHVFETAEEEPDGKPFFKAVKDGVSYTIFDMGRGELSSIYLIWAVGRRFVDSKLFLMEEPEANLSVESQRRLLDLLYYFCNNLKSSFVLSTHSPILIRRIPEVHTHKVSRFPSLEIRKNASGSDAYTFLGGVPEVCAVGVLEDVLAVKFIEELVWHLDSSIGHQVVFIKGGSASEALILRQSLANGLLRDQRFSHRLKCFTVLDGDQRGSKLTAEQRLSNMFLPGASSPEVELLKIAKNISQAGSGKHLSNAYVEMIVEGVQAGRGLNPHNAFNSLAERMGGISVAIQQLLPTALESEFYGDECRNLVSQLRSYCLTS